MPNPELIAGGPAGLCEWWQSTLSVISGSKSGGLKKSLGGWTVATSQLHGSFLTCRSVNKNNPILLLKTQSIILQHIAKRLQTNHQ